VTAHSCAEGHYDVVKRSLALPADAANWVEQPQPTFPQQAFCSVSDGERGVTIAVRGLPEAEVMDGEGGVTIAVTLLRSVGWLSRDDLSTRNGHAGPGLPTPEAQELGHHTFHYSVIPHSGGWERGFRQARAFETPMRGVLTSAHGGALDSSVSLLDAGPESLVVTAVKAAEEGEGVIVRVCNYADRAVDAAIEVPWPVRGAERVTLAERSVEALPVTQGRRIAFRCGAWEVVTLRLEV
jgi:alpha-mannosidase